MKQNKKKKFLIIAGLFAFLLIGITSIFLIFNGNNTNSCEECAEKLAAMTMLYAKSICCDIGLDEIHYQIKEGGVACCTGLPSGTTWCNDGVARNANELPLLYC